MIYTNVLTPDKRFKMVEPVGSWASNPHYAKWQPMKRFLGIFWKDAGAEFWLDMDGFIPLKENKS